MSERIAFVTGGGGGIGGAICRSLAESGARVAVADLVLENAKEESALPLNGKKKKLTRELWMDGYLRERLKLQDKQTQTILRDFESALTVWNELINRSFLTKPKQEAYRQLLNERVGRLELNVSGP